MNENWVQIVHPEVGTADVLESTVPAWLQIGWTLKDQEQPSFPEVVPESEPDTPIFNEVSDSTTMAESVQEPNSGPDSV